MATAGLLARPARKSPTADLSFTRLRINQEPRSVGTDGWVYGRNGPSDNTIMRTGDGFDTVDTGHDFGSETLYWATRVREGYVAITRDGGADTGKIYFSTSFTSGFTSVQAIRAPHLLSIQRPVVGREGGTYMLVGEYGSGGVARELWLSKDGGQTWTSIRTLSVTDAGTNCHWHAACYDPVMDRIWASAGDQDNAWFGYSDDDGSTWTQLDSGATYKQPTVMLNLPHRIATAPDRDSGGVTVDEVDPVTGDFTAARLTIDADTLPSQQFGNGPQAADFNEAYITYPPSGSGTDTLWIAGTGDGGRTWHLVYTRDLAGDSFTQGIVGPDANGKVYLKGHDGAQCVDVADTLTWTSA